VYLNESLMQSNFLMFAILGYFVRSSFKLSNRDAFDFMMPQHYGHTL